MTQPGPQGPEQPGQGPYPAPGPHPNYVAPPQFPGAYPPPPGFYPPTPPKRSRTSWVLFSVLAVIAVAIVAVAAVAVIRRAGGGSTSETTGAAPTSASAGPAGQLRSIHFAAPNVVTKPGSTDPKVELTLYEDFLCPVCGRFEQVYGPTISKLVTDGQIAVNYTMVSVLGRHDPKSYSVRAGAAGYCVADGDPAAFQRFHTALFANQPDEMATTFPTDDQLIAQARQAGAPDSVADCIKGGKYRDMVNSGARTARIMGTPTVLLAGSDIADDLLRRLDPQALLDQIKSTN